MLPYVMAAYWSSRHEATQYTPNYLMLGREVYAPVDIVYSCPQNPASSNYDGYAEELEERLNRAYSFVRNHLKRAAERNKKYYDLRVRPQRYKVGDCVYCYQSRRTQGQHDKWCRKFRGPFLVIQALGPVNLVLQRSKKVKPFCVHIDKVKPYEADEMPRSWLSQLLSDDEQQREVASGTVTQRNETVLDLSEEGVPVVSNGGRNAIAGTLPYSEEPTVRPRHHVGRPRRYCD